MSSPAICEIVAPSGMETVTSASSFVSDSTSSAQRQTATASSTATASTQHTYSSTRMPDGSRGRFFSGSWLSGCVSWSTVRSAYSSGIFGSKSGCMPGLGASSAASGVSGAGASGCSGCAASPGPSIIASTRARSSLTDASSSSSESSSRLFSSASCSGVCSSGRALGFCSAMCSSLMRGRRCRPRPDPRRPSPSAPAGTEGQTRQPSPPRGR